ncbi:hypothetical protein NHX12_021071 [Muraenolepis orangiensis]|uniref:UDP-N-acetylglucosamine transferase subunit ALG14 n=1 Tax=Muraenolepis orangiensis TaxID=630683 RepID=A0A9Q0EPD6_9TELE|nr:hypothetical protein NHX12_021071 [Muraenolepis orangiensis]
MASLVLVAVLAALCTVFVFLFRFLMVLRSGPTCKPGAKGSVCVLVVVGSGGHTTEVLRLMQSLSPCYQPRHYVLADTDRMSEEKIRAFESSKENADAASKHTVHRIPRPREVLQSWSSSVVSSLNALVHAVPLVFRLQPDMQITETSLSPQQITETSLNPQQITETSLSPLSRCVDGLVLY